MPAENITAEQKEQIYKESMTMLKGQVVYFRKVSKEIGEYEQVTAISATLLTLNQRLDRIETKIDLLLRPAPEPGRGLIVPAGTL